MSISGYYADLLPSTPARKKRCRVYWGSHGCHKRRGHLFHHRCDCCRCGALHRLLHRWASCVAKAPYYGPATLFYGEDAK